MVAVGAVPFEFTDVLLEVVEFDETTFAFVFGITLATGKLLLPRLGETMSATVEFSLDVTTGPVTPDTPLTPSGVFVLVTTVDSLVVPVLAAAFDAAWVVPRKVMLLLLPLDGVADLELSVRIFATVSFELPLGMALVVAATLELFVDGLEVAFPSLLFPLGAFANVITIFGLPLDVTELVATTF